MSVPPDEDGTAVDELDPLGDDAVSIISIVELLDPEPRLQRHTTSNPVPRPAVRTTDRMHGLPPRSPDTSAAAASLLAVGRPESPTIIERLQETEEVDGSRVERLERARANASDPERAALFAFELGDLAERSKDFGRAEDLYREAIGLAPDFRAASWGLRRLLYRGASWQDCMAELEIELRQVLTGPYRAELLLERAHLDSAFGARARTRALLEEANQLAPDNASVLFALHRELAAAQDAGALAALLPALARHAADPERAAGYLLEAVRLALAGADAELARRAYDEAEPLSSVVSSSMRTAIARARVRVADACRGDDLVHALATLAQLRASAPSNELGPLLRRQARTVRATNPARAWELLQAAVEQLPDEPLLLAELIELAVELGRFKELLPLISSWRSIESDVGRRDQISIWSARAHASEERRFAARTLLAAVASAAPGFILITTAAESRALVDASRDARELAAAYLEAARATALGTWVGPGLDPIPDARAAAAWKLQAAEILAFQIGSPVALAQAREALRLAEQLVPGDPIVNEAHIEVDETHGRPEAAIARVLAPPASIGALERAAAIASTHDLTDELVTVERLLADHEPRDIRRSWRLDATLARLARDSDRMTVLAGLANAEVDPQRKAVALYHALRLSLGMQDVATATRLAHELTALVPADEAVRDVHLDLLRGAESWSELATALEAELTRPLSGDALARRMRELAWLQEVRVGDPAAAAHTYERWLAALPQDRTALEGLARCRATLRDHVRELDVRRDIVALDDSAAPQWLLARAYERAGRLDLALQHYRHILADPSWSVAVANAALAVGDLAAASGDLGARAEAAQALADHTTDAAFASALHEAVGWYRLLGTSDRAGARSAFAAVPTAGGRFGLALASLGDHAARGSALSELAKVTDGATGAALLLRASVHAHAAQDHERALTLVEAAHNAASEDAHILVRTADEPLLPATLADPFAHDQFIARASVLARRTELAAPAARADWVLERVEMLERAGELGAASALVIEVLDQQPTHRPALEALRRQCQRAADPVREAQVCYVLASVYRDAQTKLSLLRTAARTFDGRGPSNHVGYSITIYRRIVVIDPHAPELDRLLELLRQASSQVGLFVVLGEQINTLTLTRGNDARLVLMLLQRAELLERSGRKNQAIRDLETAMAYAVDTTDVRQRLADLGVRPRTGPTPTVKPVLAPITPSAPAAEPEMTTNSGMQADSEVTDAEPLRNALTPMPGTHADLDADTDFGDPFGAATVRADPSEMPWHDEADEPPPPEHTAGPTAMDTPSKLRHALAYVDIPEVRRPQQIELDDAAWIELEPSIERRPLSDVAETLEPVINVSAAVAIPVHALRPARVSGERDQLQALERELVHAENPTAEALLRYELGTTALARGDLDRARQHLERALVSPEHAGRAARYLRRLALRRGDMTDAARLCAIEHATASSGEQDALARMHSDLLIAAGDHATARAVTGSTTRSELPFALALLDAAVLAGDDSSIATTLDTLSKSAPEGLQASLRFARGTLAVKRRDRDEAGRWFAQPLGSGVSLFSLEAIRHTAQHGDLVQAGTTLLELAQHLEREDRITAAALALRAQAWLVASERGTGDGTIAAAGSLALGAMPRDSLVCQLVAEQALATEDHEVASHAYARWLRTGASPAERAYAAGRAAELSPDKLGRVWAQRLELDGPDDYAAARLRRVLVASDVDAALEHDIATSAATGRAAPLLSAVTTLESRGDLARAIALLEPVATGSPLLRETLAPLLVAANKEAAGARLLKTAAATANELDAFVLRMHAADMWSRLSRRLDPSTARNTALASGLEAWAAVLAHDPTSPRAHAESITLARETGDLALLGRALARARTVAATPAAATTLVLQHARALVAREPKLAAQVARAATGSASDPRGTALTLFVAARRSEWKILGAALEDRIRVLEAGGAESYVECTQMRLRAIQLYLDRNDTVNARPHLEAVAASEVGAGLVADLIRVAGVPVGESTGAHFVPSLVRLLDAAERAVASNDLERASDLYARAVVEHRSPLAAEPFVRLAQQIGSHDPLRAYAESQIAIAEQTGNSDLLVEALEVHAGACRSPLGDARSTESLERVLHLDKTRADIAIRLELSHASAQRERTLRLRRMPFIRSAAEVGDTAALALACGTSLRDLAGTLRSVPADPACGLVALRLADAAAIAAAPREIDVLAQRIGAKLGERRSQAALLARAANVLHEAGDHAGAVARASAALAAWPGYVPILDTARHAALATASWAELVHAATFEATASNVAADAARLHHLAAVVAMDKLDDHAAAFASLRAALAEDPCNWDALIRFRMLGAGTTSHGLVVDAVSSALRDRPPSVIMVELHRMLAELERAAGHHERAASEYRSMLAIASTDVRAQAASLDLASHALDDTAVRTAIEARLAVERDVLVLATLHCRLASLLAPHDAHAAIAALHSALECSAGDEPALMMLVDVAATAGDLRTATSAWDQLADRAERGGGSTAAPLVGTAQRAAYLSRVAGGDDLIRSRLEHVARIARARVELDLFDVDACSALAVASDSLAESADAAQVTHRRVGRFAAELVALQGGAVEPPASTSGGLVLADATLDRAMLADTSERDALLMLRGAADAIARVYGSDVSRYGVTKRDRLRANHPVATIARELAHQLGFEDVAVYVTPRHPHAMIVEPGATISLVLGHEIARRDSGEVRFATGAGLKLGQLGLAIPARLPLGELAVLATALVRLYDPTIVVAGVDEAAVRARARSLHAASPALPELLAARPVREVRPTELARDLKLIGFKAGVVASNSLHCTLTVLAGAIGAHVHDLLVDPTVRRLIGFSLSDTLQLAW